jgi:hypothetical protein
MKDENLREFYTCFKLILYPFSFILSLVVACATGMTTATSLCVTRSAGSELVLQRRYRVMRLLSDSSIGGANDAETRITGALHLSYGSHNP